MPKLSTRSSVHRPSGGERVFADDAGRLWSATRVGTAIIFTCISDGRQPSRALAVDNAAVDDDIGDEVLRGWLEAAPRIGTLS